MYMTQEQIQEIADNAWREADIKKSYKPDIGKLVSKLGLKVVSALNLKEGVLARMVINPDQNDLDEGYTPMTIVTNAANDLKTQRYALAFQSAFFILNDNDEGERAEGYLTSRISYAPDDEVVRLTNALLLNGDLFQGSFQKAMSGIPNKAAICKMMGSQFNVPLHAIEYRAADLDVSFPAGGEIVVAVPQPPNEKPKKRHEPSRRTRAFYSRHAND